MLEGKVSMVVYSLGSLGAGVGAPDERRDVLPRDPFGVRGEG